MRGLRGRTVLLTRADCGGWSGAVKRLGGRIVHLPCIEIQPLREPALRAQLRLELGRADWLALTSGHGAAAIAMLHTQPLPERLRIAAVGCASAAAAVRLLGRCDLVPPRSSALALGRSLARIVWQEGTAAHVKIVIAAADRGRRDLEVALEPHGIEVIRIPVYRTVPAARRRAKLDLERLGVDAIVIASPSAAEGLLNLARIPAGARVISIGPTTTAAARALGLAVSATAQRPTLKSLLEVLS
ncbi:MAG TPA: uroporphyrinogen-III synthase [Acidobacteriota bacterium]